MGNDVMRGRYYWLKLPRDFFDRADIRLLSTGTKGKSYLYMYLRMLCESIDTNGYVHVRPGVAYTEHQMARWLGVQDATVREGLRLMRECSLVKETPTGELILTELTSMVGTRTCRADDIRQMRKQARLQARLQARAQAQASVASDVTGTAAAVTSEAMDGRMTVESCLGDGEATRKRYCTDGGASVDRQPQKSLTAQGFAVHTVTKCDPYIEIETEKETEIDAETDAETEAETEAEAEIWDARSYVEHGRDALPAAPVRTDRRPVREHPPTLQAVRAFGKEQGLSEDVDAFWSYYDQSGWIMHGEPMMNWRAALICWARRDKERREANELCRHEGDRSEQFRAYVQMQEEKAMAAWRARNEEQEAQASCDATASG